MGQVCVGQTIGQASVHLQDMGHPQFRIGQAVQVLQDFQIGEKFRCVKGTGSGGSVDEQTLDHGGQIGGNTGGKECLPRLQIFYGSKKRFQRQRCCVFAGKQGGIPEHQGNSGKGSFIPCGTFGTGGQPLCQRRHIRQILLFFQIPVNGFPIAVHHQQIRHISFLQGVEQLFGNLVHSRGIHGIFILMQLHCVSVTLGIE